MYNRQERVRRFDMRISAEEQTMLRELARRKGISASDYVRLMIRSAHARVL